MEGSGEEQQTSSGSKLNNNLFDRDKLLHCVQQCVLHCVPYGHRNEKKKKKRCFSPSRPVPPCMPSASTLADQLVHPTHRSTPSPPPAAMHSGWMMDHCAQNLLQDQTEDQSLKNDFQMGSCSVLCSHVRAPPYCSGSLQNSI